ncbi:MAG: 4Fe-4S binding protein [Planctomycetaceae bacterium]|nr:4Fe-4S binding protein [Planctomycetaceae bacterium]
MDVNIELNGQPVTLNGPLTLWDVLQKQRLTLHRPQEFAELAWINNPRCPLVNLLEVDGQVVPLAVRAELPVREGMKINTSSVQLDSVLKERLTHLRDRQQCAFIARLQEFTAAEAESNGMVDLEQRAQWDFLMRGSSPSVFHDPNACVRCKACVDTCNDTQQVGALSFDEEQGVLFDDAKCTRCGQCILSCPMGFRKMTDFVGGMMGCAPCPFSRPLGAMREVDDTGKVWNALKDPEKYVVVQFAPAVRATLGEEFGVELGELVTEKLYAALRRLGCRQVWDTNFSADLTIMEEGYELVDRLKNGGRLPQFTSCSPGWIRYCEIFYPDLIPHLSTAKSPQQMLGAVAKTFAAERLDVDPRKMFVLSIMPCTAKKMEAAREEMNSAYRYWLEKGTIQADEQFPDIDVVLTSREAAKLLKMAKIDLAGIAGEQPDPLLGQYTGAAPIFGRTGGVMEAALRTAYEVVAGKPLDTLEFEALGTMEGVKVATVPVNGIDVKVAVAHGLGNARKVCDSVRSGGEFASYHFIEFMGCEGGCIGGGGQIIPTTTLTRQARTRGVNRDDREHAIRKSHENPEVEQLYKDFLEKPLGHLSHHLLHTTYVDRSQQAASSTAATE